MAAIESLHSHTTLSDGKLSHAEAFKLAESLGYGVLAFTDHDALPDTATLAYLETLRGRHTKWIVGIEFTSGVPKEFPPRKGTTLHIVGLFIDPTNAALLEHCKKTQDARAEKATRVAENLTNIGYTITKEEIFAFAGGDSVGMPHIVAAMLAHPENRLRTQELMRDFERDARSDSRLAALYKETLRRGEDGYPYALFFNNNRYRDGITVPIPYKVDLDESMRLIHGAGGIGVLAHYPYLAKDVFSFDEIESLLATKRIDGMETRYKTTGSVGMGDPGILEKERLTIKSLVEKTGALATGGADAHTRQDFVHFAEDKSFSGETIGMTAEILRKRPELSTRWTSLEN